MKCVMAYIRSSSNPEQLSIWSDGTTVCVVKGPKTIGYIPSVILNELLYKYSKEGDCDTTIEVDKATVQHVRVDSLDRESFSKEDAILPINFKVKLSYDGWHIYMWEVTWDYIVNTNKDKWIRK